VTLWTRHKTLVHQPLKPLREALTGLPKGSVFDGELLDFRATGASGRLYLFDILFFKGDNLVNRPLANRRGILEIAFKDYLAGSRNIELTRQVMLGKKKLYSQSIEGENEGIVLKKLDSRYLASDSRCLQNPFWLKVKKTSKHLKEI
jgi:ATP-dependent DNA ligase